MCATLRSTKRDSVGAAILKYLFGVGYRRILIARRKGNAPSTVYARRKTALGLAPTPHMRKRGGRGLRDDFAGDRYSRRLSKSSAAGGWVSSNLGEARGIRLRLPKCRDGNAPSDRADYPRAWPKGAARRPFWVLRMVDRENGSLEEHPRKRTVVKVIFGLRHRARHPPSADNSLRLRTPGGAWASSQSDMLASR